jgi:hypothetical protein
MDAADHDGVTVDDVHAAVELGGHDRRGGRQLRRVAPRC